MPVHVLAKEALEYVTSTDVFQEFHIDTRIPRFEYYYTDRDGVLDILCHGDIIASLTRFSKLRLFQITLRENDPRYSELWWTRQVALRCPEALSSVVSVKVELIDCHSACLLLGLTAHDDIANLQRSSHQLIVCGTHRHSTNLQIDLPVSSGRSDGGRSCC